MRRHACRLAAAAVLGLALLLLASAAIADAKKPSPSVGTTTTTTTTTGTTSTSSTGVAILAPFNGSGTIEYKGETLDAQISDAAPSTAATCLVDWGDGTGGTYAAAEVAPGVYRCGAVHYWTSSGFFTITVTGVDDNGLVGTASSLIYVFS